VIHYADRPNGSVVATSAPAMAPMAPAQPATLGTNDPRLFLRKPRASMPVAEFDGNYYLPRVESMPAGAAKDF